MSIQGIQIVNPSDMHCHFRTNEMLELVAGLISEPFNSVLAMPNTTPPIETADDAIRYREQIINACGNTASKLIMSIMLTRRTMPDTVREAAKSGVKVLKYIPRGVSTNSNESVSLDELPFFYPALKAVREAGMVFSGHWESLSGKNGQLPEVAREEAAIPFLDKLVREIPELKIVIEHATTRRMIQYAKGCPDNVGVTLTVHHAVLTNAMVCDPQGRIHSPHNYCKPVAKYIWDVAAVRKAMMSGDPRFFFGSDNAPHPIAAKQKNPPAAGIFNPFAIPMLCEIFERYNKLSKLEGFLSAGERIYGASLDEKTIELIREDTIIPEELAGVVPFAAGETLHWRVAS